MIEYRKTEKRIGPSRPFCHKPVASYHCKYGSQLGGTSLAPTVAPPCERSDHPESFWRIFFSKGSGRRRYGQMVFSPSNRVTLDRARCLPVWFRSDSFRFFRCAPEGAFLHVHEDRLFLSPRSPRLGQAFQGTDVPPCKVSCAVEDQAATPLEFSPRTGCM